MCAGICKSSTERDLGEIRTFVRSTYWLPILTSYKGFAPEVVRSTFDEDFHPDSFEDIHEYPVATATQKAVEVYERLVVSL